jgi:hypothetical protein
MHASSVLIEALKAISMAPAFFVNFSGEMVCKEYKFL